MDKADVLQLILRSKHEHSTELDLSNKGIIDLPTEIGDLIELTSLNLSYNNITTLPLNICNLVNLKKLFLTRNYLTKLPIGIANLNKLEILDLSYNPLIRIPKEIGLLNNLDSLDASYCELRMLPIEITKLYNLKTLNLVENSLDFPPQKVVKRGLYAVMHFLTMEKRKKEASKVVMQIFNMPDKIQAPFRQYVKYFNQMVSEANHKDVLFDLNFINQEFFQEMDLNSGVESYLYDIMRYIQEKVETLKNTGELDNQITNIYYESRITDLKARLNFFNESLDGKLDEIKKIKQELKSLSDSLEG